MARSHVLSVLILLLLQTSPSFAMDFHRDGLALFGSGRIESGDASRLYNLLAEIPNTAMGMRVLSLDSPGGSVAAAFDVAAVMDAMGNVATVVPDGSSCASACASILFIAGKFHIVLLGGRLGLHTCYDKDDKAPDELCNERIGNFAVAHGTAHGAVFAPMQYEPPEKILWYSAEQANCWGLDRWPQGKDPPTFNQCVLGTMRDAMCMNGDTRYCPKAK